VAPTLDNRRAIDDIHAHAVNLLGYRIVAICVPSPAPYATSWQPFEWQTS
jgi:hypothetical protein